MKNNKLTGINSKNNRVWIITIVSVLALAILLSLLFFTDVFVGKAFQVLDTTTLEINEAGFATSDIVELPLAENQELRIPFGANIGTKQSPSLDFVFEYPNNVLEFVSVDTLGTGWDWFEVNTSTPNQVKLMYGSLSFTSRDNLLSGSQKIGDIVFNVKSGAQLTETEFSQLRFVDFNVVNLEDSNNVITSFSQPLGVTATPTCTDSDGGENIFLKGTISGDFSPNDQGIDIVIAHNYEDFCVDQDTVAENYCSLNNYITGRDFDCPENYVCQDGACTITSTPEVCTGEVDEDLDGAVDCADTDCANSPYCRLAPPPEVCTGGLDEDGDGDIDCADSDCSGNPVCAPTPTAEVCTGDVDEDLDGAVDCADTDCTNSPYCRLAPPPEVCTGGLDEDGDGDIDCADSDCSGNPVCAPTPTAEICTDSIDNDQDGLIDCQDNDCENEIVCSIKVIPEICSNGIDDNNDGDIDCADIAECDGQFCGVGCLCTTTTGPRGGLVGTKTETLCTDGVDNDQDGLIDCVDSDCSGEVLCAQVDVEICNNNIDDDSDGLTDCLDSDCHLQPNCVVVIGTELCGNGIDDDNDGNIDCADTDCADYAACLLTPEVCTDSIDNDGDTLIDCNDPDCDNELPCSIKVVPEICSNGIDDNNDGDIDCNDIAECNTKSCGNGCVCSTVVGPRGGLVGVKTETFCNDLIDNDGDGLIDCLDQDCSGANNCVQVDVEICSNGIDDDSDGLIDCSDSDCHLQPNCIVVVGTELCSNGVDDDNDGNIDCADTDCADYAACEPVVTCTDSDGGDNPLVKGSVNGHWLCPEEGLPIVTETDYCVDGYTVREYICNAGCDNILGHDVVCPVDHVCQDGACITSTSGGGGGGGGGISHRGSLILKLTALINGECYVYGTEKMYCDASGNPMITYDNGQLSLGEKIYMIAQMTAALKEFFNAVVITAPIGVTSADGLADYPNMFVTNGYFDGKFVVGENAPAIDNLAMTDIAASMKYDHLGWKIRVEVVDATVLDSEIEDIYAQNIIAVGMPCTALGQVQNDITRQLKGIQSCLSYDAGGSVRGEIELIKHSNGNYAMLVYGTTDYMTRTTAKVIAYRSDELSGWEMIVSDSTSYTGAILITVEEAIEECLTNDYECYVGYLERCEAGSSAYFTTDIDFSPLGFTLKTSSIFEVSGVVDGICTYTGTVKQQSFGSNEEINQQLLDSGMTQTEIDQRLIELNQVAQESTGKITECKFDITETAMLDRWKVGTISTSDPVECVMLN